MGIELSLKLLRILYVRFPWRINSSGSIIHHGILARPKVTYVRYKCSWFLGSSFVTNSVKLPFKDDDSAVISVRFS
jgi:hypothetical protein